MAQQLTEAEHRGDADEIARLAHREPGVHLGPHNLARVEHGAAQAENEALKVSAQETTAELQDLKGELKWLQLHTKREHELARDLWVANYYSARNPLRLSSLVILGVVARMFRCATRSSCWCT